MLRKMNTLKRVSRVFYTLFFLVFFSCENVTHVTSNGKRENQINGSSLQGTGAGFIYKKSPFDANNFKLPNSAGSVSNWVTTDFVTNNNELKTTCGMNVFNGVFEQSVTSNQNCVEILNNDSSNTIPLQAKDGAWGYRRGNEPDAFYQVNGFYHSNLILNRFFNALGTAHEIIHFPSSNKRAPATKYDPQHTFSYWFNNAGINQPLYVYTKQPLSPLNAYFSASEPAIGMGFDQNSFFNTQYSIEDLSVLYHEFGHAFAHILMNQRNTAFRDGFMPDPLSNQSAYHSTPYKSSLGVKFYDEAGALNEGISDFFTYFITQRPELGEWAFHGFARPMSEDSHNHSALVSKNSGERLKYPDFAYYLASSDFPDEDVHNSGQIISHYLVSLTEEFKDKCSYANVSDPDEKHFRASTLTIMLLSETLGELGDMNARGSDLFDQFSRFGSDPYFGSFFTNLNPFNSYLWGHMVNPPTFRRFAKLMAQNIKYRISDFFIGACPNFSVDDSEKLLDEYGLLLFKNYNENKSGTLLTDLGNSVSAIDTNISAFNNQSIKSGFANLNLPSQSSVNEFNRNQSVRVSKDFISLPTTSSGEPRIFIFDRQQGMNQLLASLTFEGSNVQYSQGLAGPEYNNGNLKVSPGEIIGITPNLFNSSNSPIGGAKILANDWDHMKLENSNQTYVNKTINKNASLPIANWQPCRINGWPSQSEGGIVDPQGSPIDGDCDYTTKHNLVLRDIASNARYYPDSPQPVCMVQYNDENETRWVSQDFYRSVELNLDDNNCLNNPSMSGNEFNPNECLVRVLPGASKANFGLIEPQKTWQKTLQGSSLEAPSISSNHVIVMEVNKWITPGTTFNCRFRVNFSNCSDCFENEFGEEYPDFMYASDKPFKILNFQFQVLD